MGSVPLTLNKIGCASVILATPFNVTDLKNRFSIIMNNVVLNIIFKTMRLFWLCVLISCLLLGDSHAKITIVTPTWDYQCDNGVGAFPHATDCQRFWLCREAFTNFNTIEDYGKESSNLKIHPHLFKCPNGYLFDIKRRFCRREHIASCGAQATTTTTTTTTERAEQRDIGLFGLLFGLP